MRVVQNQRTFSRFHLEKKIKKEEKVQYIFFSNETKDDDITRK